MGPVRPFIFKKLLELDEKDKEWVLDYLCSGKGVIPYQMIADFDYLSIAPEDCDFFKQDLFYSSLKDSQISTEDHKNVKKFYTLLNLKNLRELNRIYNFQDTIILCEIFEHRSDIFQKLFKYNPKKCNSASSFSG